MIQVFCNERGSGKTKELINLANSNILSQKGNAVYIDDDSRPRIELNRNIRFISTNDFSLSDFESLYGLLCGIISRDYDIENIYIDGLSNIVESDIENAAHLFFKLDDLTEKFGVNVYINVNGENEIPEFIKKYAS
ncbi:hypothetical protein [Clostridium fallax]|uniref:Twitching motility protein PilT n=1 Tax=Clostridium fallax TaxID=1533 RepID=A0A1M4SWS0_9CLOT|nr:hypothetical protein [Clostridium fallax]SHE36666.1 hypothetical protein SAMN05443638_101213 [Clostridium fallax]SQB08008.1 putative PilT-like ATPase [Clostridium fallax]